MEQRTFKNSHNYLNINIYSYLETSSGQSFNLYLNVVHFFDTTVNQTSSAAYDSCFPASVSNMHSSIGSAFDGYKMSHILAIPGWQTRCRVGDMSFILSNRRNVIWKIVALQYVSVPKILISAV